MAVPFGFSVGDILMISKLIYKIGAELKKNPESATGYQLLSIELESLDRALKSLEKIEVAQYGQKRLDSIRALALACQLPLQEFLDKIKQFNDSLGSWNTNNHSFSGMKQRLRWSAKYKDEARSLRARLAPNVATITVLLMTQSVNSLSNVESNQTKLAHHLRENLSAQSRIVAEVKKTSNRIGDTQKALLVSQSDLAATFGTQQLELKTLKRKADELLEDNARQSSQLDHQAQILTQVRDDSTMLKAESQKTSELATSMQQDVAEIKGSIPSVLGRAVDLLNAVMTGIAKMQDITRLMHRLICLASHFIVEMRATMEKLLQAFGALQLQLSRIEAFMPQRICPPIVVFRDAFNVSRSFPYDLARQWQTFQGLVTVAFTGRQGLHRVNLGQYFVTSNRIGRRLNPRFWSNAIEPGDELSMTMILDEVVAREGFCPYESCRASTTDVVSVRGGKTCPSCFRFTVISQEKSTLESDIGLSIHESDLEESTVDSEQRRFGPSCSISPREKIIDEENIDLYHSIEVSKASLGRNSNSFADTLPLPSSIIRCELCGSQFTGDYMRRDLLIHTQQEHGRVQRLHCEEPGCDKSFKRRDARFKHYRRCHPNRMENQWSSRESRSSRSATLVGRQHPLEGRNESSTDRSGILFENFDLDTVGDLLREDFYEISEPMKRWLDEVPGENHFFSADNVDFPQLHLRG